jgi:cell division protein FtsB
MDAARLRWPSRLGIAGLVALALGYVPYQLYGSSGLSRFVRLRTERDALHAANLHLRDANLTLMKELASLSEADEATLSRAAIERTARDELGLVRPGEVVFQIEQQALDHPRGPKADRLAGDKR